MMMRCLSRLVEAHRPVLIVVVADFLIWNVSYLSATITATACHLRTQGCKHITIELDFARSYALHN